MVQPGWYRDPSGTDGFRYWDGRAWTSQTSDHPRPATGAATPTGSGHGGGDRGAQPKRRRLGPILVAVVALVLVAGVLTAFVVRQLGDQAQPFTDDQLPDSTVSGWDDSSPTATPTPTGSPTPEPSPTPDPSGSASTAPLTSCPDANPFERQPHPVDGRVHGGGVSFPRIDGWTDDLQTSQVSWAYDVATQGTYVEPSWLALMGVGEIRVADGFTSPRQGAESIMQCVASSDFYLDIIATEEVKSEAITIDDRPAWWLRTDVRVDRPEIQAKGDTVDVIIIDTGDPQTFGMFLSGVSIDDARLLSIVDASIAGLRVG